jgi:hypothetical protein
VAGKFRSPAYFLAQSSKEGLQIMRGAVRYRIALLALAGLAAMGAQAQSQPDSPFQRLSGNWSGSGQVRFEQGTSEQIGCRAYYTPKPEGSDISLAIRCASTSYKIDMRAKLSTQGDRVTGQWEERTFNANGSLAGRVNGSHLSLAISGPVSGTLSVTLGDTGHRIDLKTTGTGLSGVSINFARAS